jgi:6-phosphogluconolactonase
VPREVAVLEDLPTLWREAALRIVRALHRGIAERDWAFLALPAGPFVRPVYEELRQASLDWSKVEFYFSEERGVPPSHPASAFAEADLRLFDNPRIGAHQVHRIEGEASDLDQAAARYAEELPDAFDAMLFEPGDDGRCGALYAGSPAFEQDERLVVALRVATKPVRRVALTPRVLGAALELVVVAHGSEKADVVARALEGDEDPKAYPAALLAQGAWFLDRAAAARLSERSTQT